jgi:hypothetical protein
MALLSLLGMGVSLPAFAKKAVIEWESMEGAQSYEIEFQNEGKKHIEKTHQTNWKKELNPGVYQYRIRGVDQFKRPGEWSEWANLILMPEERIQLVSPQDNEKMRFFTETPEALFQWRPLLGVHRYILRIEHDGKKIREIEVQGTQTLVQGLPSGDLEWNVVGVLENHGKKYETKASSTFDVQLVKKDLIAPIIRSPLGGVALTRFKKKVSFKWDEVDGAELYEMKLWVPKKGTPERSPAAETEQELKTFRMKSNKMDLVIPNGNYRFQVRALASINPKNQSSYAGQISVQDFVVSPHAGYQEGSGWVASSFMMAPYQYQYITPSQSATYNAAALSFIGRVSGEAWFLRFMGVGAGVDFNVFRVSGRTYLAKSGEVQLKFRIKFGNDSWGGWVFQPRVGADIRDFYAIFPVGYVGLTAIGMNVGFDLRKQLKQKWSLGLRVTYSYPLAVTGLWSSMSDMNTKASDLVLAGYANQRNLTSGLLGMYWPISRLGIGAGAYLELKSMGVYDKRNGSPQSTERIIMDGLYFYTSVLYRFGK